MKILFVVDARSTISRNWIENVIERGHSAYVLSSYPCASNIIAGATTYQIPIAFAQLARIGHNGTVASERPTTASSRALASLRVGAWSGISSALRTWLSPIELNLHVEAARELIVGISPDVVHAMRIPFEAVLAAKATPPSTPLLVSVWGNDFTLFADRNPLIARQTRKTLRRADALHCDCRRDLKLAIEAWGFSEGKPAIVLPGAGGVDVSTFNDQADAAGLREELEIADDAPVIFNPRGFRGYVRNDVFFRAIPLILKEIPQAVFVCTGMQMNPIAEKWVTSLGVRGSVRLLPIVEHSLMADLFKVAQVAVSPSLHDGTPNSLLEAMACGCFPVAGDIESVREWISDGDNGLLCDPTSQESVAGAILRALKSPELRERAKSRNLELVAQRADSKQVTTEAEGFYQRVVNRSATITV